MAITALTPRIARPDVFRGANISMSPILGSLRLTVARRDGRVFLHITSLLPVGSLLLWRRAVEKHRPQALVERRGCHPRRSSPPRPWLA